MKNLRLSLLTLAALPWCGARSADLFWGGGNANIAINGDGLSTYTGGTWSTAIANWDQGPDLSHVVWNSGDNAVFAGTYATGIRTITIGSNLTVGQIRINTGSTGGNRYDIGASNTQNDFAITFNGTYGDSFAAIEGTTTGFLNNNFNAKITGTIDGGLVIKHGSNITTPGSSGRFALTNANNDFTGDLVMMSGNLGTGTQMGAPGNKLVLKGGSLFASGGAAYTSAFSRNIDVAAASGISTNAATSGLQVLELTGALTGTADLIRYSATAGSAISELRLQGDLSGYSGLFENRGTAATRLTIQSTATSGGSWKLTGGSTKLDTASDDAIAHGAGKSDLLMNGGTLDLNGNPETINGLSGPSGFVLNSLAATEAVLTLGAADATASFSGAIQNGTGTVALVKTGGGSQTLGGNHTFTGATTIEDGTLILGGTLADSPVTVKDGARLTVSAPGRDLQALRLEGGSTLAAPLDLIGTAYLGVDDSLTFSGGSVTIIPTFDEVPALGSYDMIIPIGGITGTATLTADFSSNGPTRVSGSVQAVDNVLRVTVDSLGASLTWNNAAATGVWDAGSAANFLNGASDDVFKQYDTVNFGPASPAGTVLLNGTLLPIAVAVNSPNDFTFAGSGTIGGSATLTKSGEGTLVIETTNTTSGDVRVTAGTLQVTGSLGSGELTVDSGATLKGGGTITGPINVSGLLSPGAGVGTLTTGPATLTGTYACELDGAAGDRLVVTGNLDLAGAVLTVTELSAPTAPNYLIATYTGALSGSFASIPAGYIIDTSAAGKLILWRESAAQPPAGSITFEQDQGYPPANGTIAGISPGGASNAAFAGVEGWSLSTSSTAAVTRASASSGEYFGGQAIGTSDANTYVGGKLGSIEVTGSNTISFDAPYFSGTQVGLFKDVDADGLFDGGAETGMSFGIGGSPARFNYRNTAFGSENFGTGFTGVAGNWYRFAITIGSSVAGERAVTMAVRNLTTGQDYDFDAVAEGTQAWSFTVTDTQFGFAPELADGIFVRTTSNARIDNLRITSVEPPAAGTYAGWADLNGVTGGMADDDDLDGVANGIEFFMGEDSNGFTAMPSPDANRTITWTKGGDYNGAYGPAAGFVVETSTNLSGWDPVPEGEIEFDGNQISYTLPAGEDKIFTRLKVMGPE